MRRVSLAHVARITAMLACVLAACMRLPAQQPMNAPLPDIRQLMAQVQAHQRELDQVRESYTYTAFQTTDDIDSNGRVKKSQTEEHEAFFVHGHVIERTVKRNGQPLTGHDMDKESERVAKLVEKAEKIPHGQALEGPSITVSRILELMEVRNPRREIYRGHRAVVFDFVGRKDAKTHGMAEDASKKLAGTMWIDEADRQVAHLFVHFTDDFRVAGGLFASIQKGSSFQFDQAPVEDGLWLPTGGEGNIQARVLLVKGIRQHVVERDYGYKRFRVEAQSSKDAQPVPPVKK